MTRLCKKPAYAEDHGTLQQCWQTAQESGSPVLNLHILCKAFSCCQLLPDQPACQA